ncbi:ABC transporter permease [Nocardioides cavernae]|uniref:ABC transporter permease n=1 Tax=Nocardioides cavernae TaxID=1921566 RepID=A0ABR8NE87_9ACTN|nr:ABC transporter permease [Nocardioides cavernae]MBD3926185.1 ABC transporter permease [Nocardioides cavernae]MBM7513777.1 ribose transport system permease protein [Nocardioides cavernae]
MSTSTDTSSTTAPPLATAPPERRRFAAGALVRRSSLVVLWLVMAVVFFALADVPLGNFLQGIFARQTPLVLLGLAVVITMAVGEFDLSFPSVYALSGAAVSSLVVLHGWSFGAAALAAVVLAVLVGALNALLVVRAGINSVIVTLGVGSVALGLGGWISQETTISGLDFALSNLALARVAGLPLVFWYGVVLVAVAAYVMAATPLGRHILFVGSNRDVARLAGIRVTRIRVGAWLTSALLCGVAGVVTAAGLGGFNATSAREYFLPAFASVFLGTVAVVPGRFNPIGMFVAVYFLITGVFGLQLLGYQGWVTDVFYGGVLVIAVAASACVQRRVRS